MKANKIIMAIILLMSAVGCSKEDSNAPLIKGFLNGQEIKELTVTKGTEVIFKYDVKASSNLQKIEVFLRKNIGLATESQLLVRKEAVSGDLNSNTISFSDTLIADTDLFISIGAIDDENNITTLQLNVLVDVTEFKDVVLMDAKPEGTSKSFLNTKYGLQLFAGNTKADPAAIDFGFAYLEADVNARACLISFNEYAKTGAYTLPDAKNITSFKRALTYVFNNASDLTAAYQSASEFPVMTGYTAGLVAPNLQLNDVVSFKTVAGKYGLLQVTAVDTKADAANNEQTIKFNLVVQK